MSELDGFLRELALAKAQKKAQQEVSVEHLGDFLSVVAEAKSQDPKHQMLREVKGRLQEDIVGLFTQLKRENHSEQASLSQIPPESAGELVSEDEQKPEVVLTEVITPEVKPASQIHSQDEIEKYLKTNASFQQPNPDVVDPNVRAIQDKLKFLEQAIGKIAATGPGSGEVNFRWLDDVDRASISPGRFLTYNPATKKFTFDEVNTQEVVYNTTIVVTPTYTVQEGDYYVGVDYAGPCTITLPTTSQSGRVIIIKDEDGDAEVNPITVLGTVDNDAGGFVLQLNNGAIQLIYRNGWRII